ncbi:uncharacterized protein FN964_003853 [Alca torda]
MSALLGQEQKERLRQMCSLEVDTAGSAYEYHPPEHKRDRLDVHVSWTIGWTIFWDERYMMTTADLLRPAVVLVCYISQLLNDGQERKRSMKVATLAGSGGQGTVF